jgi:curved DNA-binding protein CbpA
MKRVSRAYAVLSDADRRRRYDAELKRTGEFPSEPPTPERKSIPIRAMITFGWLMWVSNLVCN